MQRSLKLVTYAAKAVGLASTLDLTGISPQYGVLIFLCASLLKDTLNRVGDYLDDKKLNNSFNN